MDIDSSSDQYTQADLAQKRQTQSASRDSRAGSEVRSVHQISLTLPDEITGGNRDRRERWAVQFGGDLDNDVYIYNPDYPKEWDQHDICQAINMGKKDEKGYPYGYRTDNDTFLAFLDARREAQEPAKEVKEKKGPLDPEPEVLEPARRLAPWETNLPSEPLFPSEKKQTGPRRANLPSREKRPAEPPVVRQRHADGTVTQKELQPTRTARPRPEGARPSTLRLKKEVGPPPKLPPKRESGVPPAVHKLEADGSVTSGKLDQGHGIVSKRPEMGTRRTPPRLRK